jgi:2-haloacid dehalogenase
MNKESNAAQADVILLDVYETLLSMNDVEKKVNQLTDSKRGYILWFELFMQYCAVDNLLASHHDFNTIAGATLKMTGGRLGKKIDDDDCEDVVRLLKHLSVQEEVQEGLSKLSSQGYRLAALTNTPEKVVSERMERTGMVSYFEMVLSAESVKKYKPAKEVYVWAAERLKTPPSKILMVTAHDWDIAGASNAGFQTAFIKKEKHMLYPLSPEPGIVCRSLNELADILARNK